MLLAKGEDDVWLGLNADNLLALLQGNPVVVDMARIGGEGRTVIFYGEDDAALRARVAGRIGPETVFKDMTKER